MERRVFLESDVYGREYFDRPDDGDLLAQVLRVLASAEKEHKKDHIVRRVGIQVDRGLNVKKRWLVRKG